MRVERNVSTLDDESPAVMPAETVDGYVVADPVPQVVVPVAHQEVVRTTSDASVSPASIAGGIVAVGLLIFGGVVLARAGLDGSFDEPVVRVAGFDATALLGLFTVGAGAVLLIASLARARGAILLFSIVIGISAVIAAIEPDVGHGALAIERSLAVLVAVASAVVIACATLVPTVRRTTNRYERI